MSSNAAAAAAKQDFQAGQAIKAFCELITAHPEFRIDGSQPANILNIAHSSNAARKLNGWINQFGYHLRKGKIDRISDDAVTSATSTSTKKGKLEESEGDSDAVETGEENSDSAQERVEESEDIGMEKSDEDICGGKQEGTEEESDDED